MTSGPLTRDIATYHITCYNGQPGVTLVQTAPSPAVSSLSFHPHTHTHTHIHPSIHPSMCPSTRAATSQVWCWIIERCMVALCIIHHVHEGPLFSPIIIKT